MKQFSATPRQNNILQYIAGAVHGVSVGEMLRHFETTDQKITRITLVRSLNGLMHGGLIERRGAGRSVHYVLSENRLLVPFDAEKYFALEPDKRSIIKNKNPLMGIKKWCRVFDQRMLQKIHRQTLLFQKGKYTYSPQQLKRELERITVEFSWKSSAMEGNTYSLLDTERLIREKKEAPYKKSEEAVMILNHKEALEYAHRYARQFKKITVHTVREFHSIIVKGLNVRTGFRTHGVGIIGTAYKPHDTVFQIRERIEELCTMINKMKEPLLKAIIAVIGISYIQPFEDGNKRTARLLGNALLLAYGYCPLSYRSVDEIEYKKALILFYEQHSIFFFRKIFLEQYFFALENYFL